MLTRWGCNRLVQGARGGVGFGFQIRNRLAPRAPTQGYRYNPVTGRYDFVGLKPYVLPRMPTQRTPIYRGVQEAIQNSRVCRINEPVDLTAHRKLHILNRHRYGSNKPNKTEFPEEWSDAKILHYISDIATDPRIEPRMGRWGTPILEGEREGIKIRVDLYPVSHPNYSGYISTGFPTNTVPNP